MYKRGDIVAVKFPFSDFSTGKIRPAVVMSNSLISASDDLILAMITSKFRSKDVVVEITDKDTTSKLPKNSFVKCHRITAVDKSLILYKISSLNTKALNSVFAKIVSIISPLN